MSGYPPNPPAYNPSAPPPQQSGVGFEHYQQGANPPYSQPPPQYSPYPNTQSNYPQQHYPQQPHQAPYQGPMYAPEGNVLYREQPKTVYVYQEDQRRKDNTDECLLFALCAACLCCCLMND